MHVAQFLTTLRLDSSAPTPLFRQLYAAIKQAVLAGQLQSGMQLPPTRELSTLAGVSRQTVLNAYELLVAEGFLTGAVGKGTFISAGLPLAAQSGQPIPGATPPLLRPLSPRGQRFAGARVRLNVPSGAPRAFRLGMPATDVFPFDLWARLESRRWRRPSYQLGYDDPAGYPPLRRALAAYVSASRGVRCTAEQIVITSGSQQGLFLAASMLLAPGDAAWVEEPGYRGMIAALHAADVRACPVPVDTDGLCVAAGAVTFPEAKLAYVTPSHQLPLGVTMSLPRRLALLEWAAASKAWVIEDDYDSEYRYTGPPVASLQSLDQAGCVIYIGTLSKILFPGLRLGYMVLPAGLSEAFAHGKAIMDRHTPTVPQMVLADFIAEGHFSRHIRRTREVHAERRAALLDALNDYLAQELEIGPADAGLHLAVTFRDALDDRAIAHTALQKGIEVRALSQTCHFTGPPGGGKPLSGLVLGFAPVPAAQLRQGVVTLREVVRKA